MGTTAFEASRLGDSFDLLSGDVLSAVGNVPTVRLGRLDPLCQRQNLYLKLEACNPGGSIKEKNAVFLVTDAERRGLLRPGGTIVESSSGNFGIGLAMVGAARGYRVMIVVDAKTAPPMRRMLRAYGAELVDVPLSAADKNGSMQIARMNRARELADSIPGAWYPCQHLNPLNPKAHAVFTAREIERTFNGAPDYIVVGVSTAGQLSGLVEYFRTRRYPVRFVAVDVAGSAILGTPVHPYKMTGVGLSFVPPAFDASAIACAFSVRDELAFSVCHALAKREGLLLGGSTGAIVAAGLKLASIVEPGQRILLINPDRGDRYLETIYNEEWLAKNGLTLSSGEELSREISYLRVLHPLIPQVSEERAHAAL